MKKYIILCLACIFLHSFLLLHAQQSVGIGTATLNPGAKLNISDTTKGLLAPRLTTTQRMAIPSPAKGLIVFGTSDYSFYYYNGSWQRTAAAVKNWNLKGNAMK